MATQHMLPVPQDLLSHACEMVTVSSGRLPFIQNGVEVNEGLLQAAIEELNAEPNRTLAIRARTGADGRIIIDGLDRHLSSRGFESSDSAETIAQVLIKSEICQKASVADKRAHRFRSGVRLLPPWTWTVASGESTSLSGCKTLTASTSAGSLWTSVCPVCRDGVLNPSAGRLFGVPETEFLICTTCGARFVPDSGRFRLVAIAHTRDPEWARLLNRTFSADEWLAMAQGRAVAGMDTARGHRKTVPGRIAKGSPATRHPPDKFTVEAGNRTFYFCPVELQFGRGTVQDLFTRRKDPLRTILALPEYQDYAKSASTRYPRYLDIPVGFFLRELKSRGDDSYRQFLNPWGDEPHCMFRVARTGLSETRGVYIIVQDGVVRHCGMSLRSLKETIDEHLGRLPPGACYRDGNAGYCEANTLICSNRKTGGGVYVYPLIGDEEIRKLVRAVGTGTLPPSP